MNCKICQGDTCVLHKNGGKRRRKCLRCGHRFNTFERTEDEVERADDALKKAKALAETLLEATHG